MRALPHLMLVTRPTAGDEELAGLVDAAIAGGVDLVQWRDKQAPPERMVQSITRLRQVTGGRARLLVNHPDWRHAAGIADGVHLPEQGPPVAEVRSEVGSGKWVGRSVHALAAALASEEEGADYLVAGTIFASSSHPGITPAGLALLQEICAHVSLPVLAIGGVTPENAADCLRAGAAGVAVLSPIMDAADPRRAAAALRASVSPCFITHFSGRQVCN